MKNLRLTILLDDNTSKVELANTFGQPTEIALSLKYLQWEFSNIKMLTAMQITPIYNLINSYEKQHTPLRFKMLHLYDEKDYTYSPASLQCLKGMWSITSSMTGAEGASSRDLLTLI